MNKMNLSTAIKAAIDLSQENLTKSYYVFWEAESQQFAISESMATILAIPDWQIAGLVHNMRWHKNAGYKPISSANYMTQWVESYCIPACCGFAAGILLTLAFTS